MDAATGLKAKLIATSKALALKEVPLQLNKGTPFSKKMKICDRLVNTKIKKAIGMDECLIAITGSAPLSMKTQNFFCSINLPLQEGFGMSETTAPQSGNLTGSFKMGTIGIAMNGTYMRVDKPDANGDGELVFRGRNMFMGYLKNDKETRATIDSEGWVHSGDMGRVDNEGYQKITGRIKELIITAGGENVAPALLEGRMKEYMSALASQIVVIGDQKKYLTCLITLKSQPDPTTMLPTDKLLSDVVDQLKANNSKSTTLAEAARDPVVQKLIQVALDKSNSKTVSRADTIKKFTVLPNEFTVDGGEMTPTMKLKRKTISQK